MTSKYKNKNGEKKLLAIVAVFAMMFAALAGAFVIVSDDVNAAGETGKQPISGALTLLESDTTIENNKAYYLPAGPGIILTNGVGDGVTATIYLVSGAKLTFATVSTSSTTVTVYAATKVDSQGVPTEYMAGLSYAAESGKVVEQKAGKGINLATTVSGGSEDSKFNYDFVVNNGTDKIYHVGEVPVSIATAGTYNIGIKEGKQVSVSDSIGGQNTYVLSTVSGDQTATITVTATPALTLSGSDVTVDVKTGSVKLAATVPTVIGGVGPNSTPVAGNVISAGFTYDEDGNIASDCAVFGEKHIAQSTEILSGVTVTLATSDSKLYIDESKVLTNAGTITGASGELINYGIIKNGADATSESAGDAKTGIISVSIFKNGTDASEGTPGVPTKKGEFENYGSSRLTSASVSNASLSTLKVMEDSTLTLVAVNNGSIVNYGLILNEGTLTFGKDSGNASTYVGEGKITNNGTINVKQRIAMKIASSDASIEFSDAVKSIFTNNGVLNIDGRFGLYVENGDEGTVVVGETAKIKYFTAAIGESAIVVNADGYLYGASGMTFFFPGDSVEAEITDGQRAISGPSIGDGFTVYNSDAKTKIQLLEWKAVVTYSSTFTIDGGDTTVPTGNLYAADATVNVMMIGVDMAVSNGVILITAAEITDGAVLTSTGYVVISSDLGLSKVGQVVASSGKMYIYGKLDNVGLASTPAGFVDNSVADVVVNTDPDNEPFFKVALTTTATPVTSQTELVNAKASGVSNVKITTDEMVLQGEIDLSGMMITVGNDLTLIIKNGAEITGSTIKGENAASTVKIENNGVVTFVDTVFKDIKVSANSQEFTFKNVTAVDGSLKAGSGILSGVWNINTEVTTETAEIVSSTGDLVLDGKAVNTVINIGATGKIDVKNLTIVGNVTISYAKTTFTEGPVKVSGLIKVDSYIVVVEDVNVEKTVVTAADNIIKAKVGASISVAVGHDYFVPSIIDNSANLILTINSQAELLGGIDYYDIFQLGQEVTLDGIVGDTLTIGKKTIILDGKDLKITGDVAFNETTVTEYGGTVTGGSLKVTDDRTASLTLTDANIFATVVDEDDNITIASALVSAWGQDSAQTIMVGYGNTLNMDSVKIVSGQEIAIYGILNNKGTTSISAGASIVIKAGAVANNTGTMTILGDVDVYGTFNNSGVVTVGDNNGNAKVTVDGDGKLVLKDGSSMTVKALKAAEGDNNELAGTGKVIVDVGAVLTINGLISVNDVALKGTFAMNGAADNTEVQIFDGITVSVTSVDGTIKFSDAGIVDDDVKKENDEGVLVQKPNTILYDGNLVILTDVKGVTVSEAVKVGSVKIDEDNCKYYLCQMTVSGAVTEIKDAESTAKVDVDKTATIKATHTGYTGSKGIVIIDDLTLGKDVGLETSGYVTVNGTITAVEEDSYVALGNGATDMVTVNGLIVILDDPLAGNISAAMYNLVNVEKGETTYYYTTFTEAIKAAETSYENTVVLYGSITISSSATIAKPIVVELASGSTVTIKSTADVVFEDGSKFDAFNAKKVTVSGTLTIIDKDTGIIEPSVKDNFYYEVLLTDVDAPQKVVYAGLVGVLKNAEAGQTVTMQKNSAISEDLEIKEGVTLVVPEKLVLTIGSKTKEITITVNGTIQVLKNANIVSAANTKKITIVDNGVISSYNDDEYSDIANLSMTNYAEFNIDDKVYYRSNIAYAAENCHEGIIKVIGQISAGDLVFTKDEKATELKISVETPNVEGIVYTNLYASSITLDQVVLYIDANSKVTGEIIAASIGGDASVEFDGVSNIAVESYYDDVKEEDHMYIYGVPTGTITIATGNVEVKDVVNYTYNASADLIVYNSIEHAVKLVVLDKATFTVPKSASLYTIDMSSIYGEAIVIEGTFDVKSGSATINDMYLTGTMNVEGKYTEIYYSVIAGTLDVKEKTETTAEGLAVVDSVKIGDVPTFLGAAGTVIGNINIDDRGYIYVYAGSDVSKAKINYNLAEQKNGAKSTVVNINGTDFVTVYSNGTVNLYTALNELKIQLYGLEEPEFDSDMNMYSAATLKTEDKISNADRVTIGQYDKVYFDIDVVGIRGMISEGQGVILMIDGNTINNYYAGISAELGNYILPVGTYKVTYEPAYGYEDKGIKITFNGSVVTDGKITVTADMKTFTLTVSDATPADPVTPITPVDPSQPEKDDGMGITEYLLIVLVILAAILVVVVAIRMMRS